MSKEIPLLNAKINTLEAIDKSWQHTDSIRKVNELAYLNTISNDSIKIAKLNKTNKSSKYVAGISILVNILLGWLAIK